MDEASSRYVDKIVMEKILNEKLEKVHHYPSVSVDELKCELLDDILTIKKTDFPLELLTSNDTTFLSPIKSGYSENDIVPVKSFASKEKSIATILFLHGLFEDNREIYKFLINGMNKAGFDVKLLALPFHYERKPENSLFSGEYFWSADIVRTRNAFRQAVCEMYQIYTWFENNSNKPVFITGFSMGGAVSLMLTTIYKEILGLQIINPAAAFTDIVWDSPLCRTIREDYITAGYTIEDVQKVFAIFEPVGAKKSDIDRKRINLIYGLYDQVTDLQQYNKLIEKWRLTNVIQYKSGHLNILRVPRLADDITGFFKTLM